MFEVFKEREKEKKRKEEREREREEWGREGEGMGGKLEQGRRLPKAGPVIEDMICGPLYTPWSIKMYTGALKTREWKTSGAYPEGPNRRH